MAGVPLSSSCPRAAAPRKDQPLKKTSSVACGLLLSALRLTLFPKQITLAF